MGERAEERSMSAQPFDVKETAIIDITCGAISPPLRPDSVDPVHLTCIKTRSHAGRHRFVVEWEAWDDAQQSLF